MMYHVVLPPKVQKQLDKLPDKIAMQLETHLLALRMNPRPQNSIKLEGEESYRLKSGNYRIIYDINDKAKVVSIRLIADRKDAYKKH